MFKFKRLIEKYKVSFVLEKAKPEQTPVSAEDFDDQGRPKETPIEPVIASGALVPLPARLIYQSGGRLTEADRILYSIDHAIPLKSKITYKGLKYSVESKTPYEDYADFTQYTLKAVSSFD
jgi:hypothetical protein